MHVLVTRIRILTALGAVALTVACGSEAPPASPESGAASAPPALATPEPSRPPASVGSGEGGYRGTLPPLPASPFPPPRPPEMIAAVYEFAARRPDVLRYVPCFCGCERNGHGNNEDCFVSGRDADGRPRWDTHGMG